MKQSHQQSNAPQMSTPNKKVVSQYQSRQSRTPTLANSGPHKHAFNFGSTMTNTGTASKANLNKLLNADNQRDQPLTKKKQLNEAEEADKIVKLATKENPNECTCPEIIEEKIRVSSKDAENQNDPTIANRPQKFNRYARGKFLGKGGFAQCYEVTRIYSDEHPSSVNKVFALKVIPKANLTRSKTRQKLTSEIKIHRSLHHENVANFVQYFEDKQNVYIMLDLCENQSLSDLIKRRRRLTELEAKYYVHQLIKACQYVHKQRVIHRDLKLGNLFLTADMKLKVGDFGLAAQIFYDGEKKKTVCGTPNYLAPEVLDNKSGHSYEVDYWSIGVIFYTMLCGRPPFESQDVKQTYKKIKLSYFQFPETVNISEQGKDFVRKCLVVDPNLRLDLDEMLQHDLFTTNELPEKLYASTLVCPPNKAFLSQYSGCKTPAKGTSKLQKSSLIKEVNLQETTPLCGTTESKKPDSQNKFNGRRTMPTAACKEFRLTDNTPKASKSPDKHNLFAQIALRTQDNKQNGQSNGENTGLTQGTHINSNELAENNGIQEVPQFDNFMQSHNQQELRFNKNNYNTEQVKKHGRQTSGAAKNINSTGGRYGTRQLSTNSNPLNRSPILKDPAKNTVTTDHLPQMKNSGSTRNCTNLPFSSKTANNKLICNSKKLMMTTTAAAVSTAVEQKATTLPGNVTASQQNVNEIAKIQDTVAASIPIDNLIQSSHHQEKNELELELVTKFVDFSSKYGLGYKLSNHSYGVHFNDSSKIITCKDLFHFDYIYKDKVTQQDVITPYDFFNYPSSINKKVVLLQHFKSYLDGNSKFTQMTFNFDRENAPTRSEDQTRLPYIKKWKRAKKALLLRNSNKVIQVIFQDQSELILLSESNQVTFINSKKQVKIVQLQSEMSEQLQKTDPSLFKRLSYAKEILVQMINKNGQIIDVDGFADQCRQSVVSSLMQALPNNSQASTTPNTPTLSKFSSTRTSVCSSKTLFGAGKTLTASKQSNLQTPCGPQKHHKLLTTSKSNNFMTAPYDGAKSPQIISSKRVAVLSNNGTLASGGIGKKL